ncbi:hypothetical protein AB0H37_43770 [Actinomadura sp. NPDC023710]|uniref:hypothetical protein n=1 Tax=Actinomadura sp. NPDC023710 TaxID=3158219 RepID=UPI0033DB3C45
MSVQSVTEVEGVRAWVQSDAGGHLAQRLCIGTTVSHASAPVGMFEAKILAEDLLDAADRADRLQERIDAIPGTDDQTLQALFAQASEAERSRQAMTIYTLPIRALTVIRPQDRQASVTVTTGHLEAALSPTDARDLAGELLGRSRGSTAGPA